MMDGKGAKITNKMSKNARMKNVIIFVYMARDTYWF